MEWVHRDGDGEVLQTHLVGELSLPAGLLLPLLVGLPVVMPSPFMREQAFQRAPFSPDGEGEEDEPPPDCCFRAASPCE